MTDNAIARIIKKVHQIEIRTHRLVTDALAGAYHSTFKGQGMDFEEVREYAPGDEIRAIDWNVTAKMDRPFIKKFREERELTLMLVVDLSASGSFGSLESSKRELAAELASVLAFSAARNNDKVGLLLFTDQIETFVAPRKGRQHILRLIREMLFFEPRGRGTDIPCALNFLNKVLHRRSVVFLLSDFLNTVASPHASHTDKAATSSAPLPDALLRLLALTHRRHDLIGVALSDPREHELPDIGLITLEDAETGDILEIDTSSAAARQQYAESNQQRCEALQRSLRQKGIDLILLSTDQPYLVALRQFFAARTHQR